MVCRKISCVERFRTNCDIFANISNIIVILWVVIMKSSFLCKASWRDFGSLDGGNMEGI